jgi:cytochrome c2
MTDAVMRELTAKVDRWRSTMIRVPLVAIAALTLMALPYVAMAEPGNPTRGERMYRACVACHSLEPNRNMTGPSLAEIWNRKSGSLASFPRYSPVLKSAGIVWNDDTLDEWIKDPQHFIPGNTMTFQGMKDARQRADLLAFLKEATQPGRAPKTAQGGNQMGGMTMGGAAVQNLSAVSSPSNVELSGTTRGAAASRGQMSALGHKQTKRPAWTLSALPPKADIERGDGHVRFVPKADSCTATEQPLLNNARFSKTDDGSCGIVGIGSLAT